MSAHVEEAEAAIAAAGAENLLTRLDAALRVAFGGWAALGEQIAAGQPVSPAMFDAAATAGGVALATLMVVADALDELEGGFTLLLTAPLGGMQ